MLKRYKYRTYLTLEQITAGRAGFACGENVSHSTVQFSVKQELNNNLTLVV
jgi:hypothetical protein